MNFKKVVLNGFLQALGAVLYCGLIASFISWLQSFHGEISPIVGFAVILLLLSASVAAMGSIVFGQPMVWFISGRKKEAVQLAVWTIGFMLAFSIFFFCIIALRGSQA